MHPTFASPISVQITNATAITMGSSSLETSLKTKVLPSARVQQETSCYLLTTGLPTQPTGAHINSTSGNTGGQPLNRSNINNNNNYCCSSFGPNGLHYKALLGGPLDSTGGSSSTGNRSRTRFAMLKDFMEVCSFSRLHGRTNYLNQRCGVSRSTETSHDSRITLLPTRASR